MPITNNHKVRNFRVSLAWFLFAVPVVLYAYSVIKFTVNIPYWDDYVLILQFVNKFLQADSLRLKLWLVFLPHNEHRMVVEKALFLLQVALTGKVNIQLLNYLGNLAWLVCVGILTYAWNEKNAMPRLEVLAVPYFLLSFITIENMFFASASLPFFWCVLFLILALFLLQRERYRLFALLATAALFTSGGGLMIIPLSALFLLYKKRYRALLAVAAWSVCVLAIYFYQYPLAQKTGGIFSIAIVPRLATYFVMFLGAPFQLISFIPGSAFVAGAALLLLAAWLWKIDRSDEFTWLLVGLVVLTAGETALLRSQLGLEQALSSRYSQYPLLFLCSLVILGMRQLRRVGRHRAAGLIVVLLAMLSFGWIMVVYRQGQFFERQVYQKVAGLRFFQAASSQFLLNDQEDVARKALQAARSLGVYDYRTVNLPLMVPQPGALPPDLSSSPLPYRLEQYDAYRIAASANQQTVEPVLSVLLVLDNGQQVYLLPTLPQGTPGDFSISRVVSQGLPAFEVYPLAYDLPAGTYKAGLLIQYENRESLHWLPEALSLP